VKNIIKTNRVAGFGVRGIAWLMCLVLLAPLANAQENSATDREWKSLAETLEAPRERIAVPSWRFAHGPHVRSAFREVVADTRQATVEIRSDGKRVALGGIVGADGWILTKSSSLVGPLTCRLSDGRELDARVVGASREFDVAMLKIEAKQLPTLKIPESDSPLVGSWLASVGMESYPIAVGIVSVTDREIPHQSGILGIQLDENSEKATVVRVFPNSAASTAGILVNDVLLSINRQPTPTRESLIETVQGFSSGDRVEVEVQRDDEVVTVMAVLMGRFPGQRPDPNEFQNRLGSRLSERRYGFPNAFQHDTVIQPNDVGGPVVNLDGDVVGFNIARSGRTETYAITASSVTKLLYDLMSGNLPPELEPPTQAAEADISVVPDDDATIGAGPLVPTVPDPVR